MPRDGSTPVVKRPGGAESKPPLWAIAQALEKEGRRGDTILAHITKKEAARLKKEGGAGTKNPITGLPEFYDGESADGGTEANAGIDPGTDTGNASISGGPGDTSLGGGVTQNESQGLNAQGDRQGGGGGPTAEQREALMRSQDQGNLSTHVSPGGYGFNSVDEAFGKDNYPGGGLWNGIDYSVSRAADKIGQGIDYVKSNPVEVFTDLAFGMVPVAGLANSAAKMMGLGSVGKFAQAGVNSLRDTTPTPSTEERPGDLTQVADAAQQQGRFGDTQLVHMNNDELQGLSHEFGPPTINPKTGLPEFWSIGKFFKSALPALGGLAGYALGADGGAISSGIGAGLGTGAGSLLAGNSAGDSFKNALLGGVSGAALSGLGGFSGIGEKLGIGGAGFGGSGSMANDLGASAGGSSGSGVSAASLAPAGAAGDTALDFTQDATGDYVLGQPQGAITDSLMSGADGGGGASQVAQTLGGGGAGLPPAAAAAPSAGTPGFDYGNSWLGKTGLPQNALTEGIAKNPGAAIAAGGLAYNAMAPSALSGQEDLQAQAKALGLQGSELASYLRSGTLPPGAKAALDQATASGKAAIRSKYASMGQSGSTAEMAELNDLDLRAAGQGFSIASNLLQTGINETGLSSKIYQSLMNVDQRQNAETGQAISNFGLALSGGPAGGLRLTNGDQRVA